MPPRRAGAGLQAGKLQLALCHAQPADRRLGVGAIPAVAIRREIAQGLLHPVRVAKHCPPIPIVASYPAGTDRDFIRRVVEQAKASAAQWCAGVGPALAWIDAALRFGARDLSLRKAAPAGR